MVSSEAVVSSSSVRCWKYSQLVCYLVAFIGGVIASVKLGSVVQKFDGKCPMYTALDFLMEKEPCGGATGQNCSVIHVLGGDAAGAWGPRDTCDFTIFTAAAAAIYAFILAYFILVCDRTEKISRGSGSRNRMTSLFFPLLITSILFALLMLVSSVKVLIGSSVFCQQIQKSIDLRCSEAQYYKWKDFVLTEHFYMTLLTGLIFSWVSAGAFIMSVLILILRCFTGVDNDVIVSGVRFAVNRKDSMCRGDYGTTSLPIPVIVEPKPGPSSASI